MRQLGQGQSVMFLAPPETDTMIRKSRSQAASAAPILTEDIIRWTMEETCNDLLHHAPHWAQQGLDYLARQDALGKLPRKPSSSDIARLKQAWLQKEARTLVELYDSTSSRESLDTSSLPYPQLVSRLRTLGIENVLPVNLDEEQEREVSHEVQIERDVERPRNPKPCEPSLHHHVRMLVSDGIIVASSAAFQNAFSMLEGVRYQKSHKHTPLLASRLLVTKTFANTVTGSNDAEFLKPVQWVLSLRTAKANAQPYLIILSQFEVNALLPSIRKSQYVRLHIYSARTSVSSQIFDDLGFHCIPPLPAAQIPQNPALSLIEELNMFSGQLYLSSYDAYLALANFLGIDVTEGSSYYWRSRFMQPVERKQRGLTRSPFQVNPMRFFKELTALRRKGQEFDSTPLGRILNGQRLRPSDFTQNQW